MVKINHPWLNALDCNRKWLKVGTIPTFKMHNIGTVSMFIMYDEDVETQIFYDNFSNLELGVCGENKWPLIASGWLLCSKSAFFKSCSECPRYYRDLVSMSTTLLSPQTKFVCEQWDAHSKFFCGSHILFNLPIHLKGWMGWGEGRSGDYTWKAQIQHR